MSLSIAPFTESEIGQMMDPKRKPAPIAERESWILKYIAEQKPAGAGVDVLDLIFAGRYILATHARCRMTFYGAPKCPMLGRDLARLAAEGWLERSRVGLWAMAGQGFPRWVWAYTLTDNGAERAAVDASLERIRAEAAALAAAEKAAGKASADGGRPLSPAFYE